MVTLNGAANVTHTLGSAYADLGATALDAADGNLTTSIIAFFSVPLPSQSDGQVVAETYSCRDAAGNLGTAVRWITVRSGSGQSGAASSTPTGVIIGVVVGVILIILLVLGVFVFQRRQRAPKRGRVPAKVGWSRYYPSSY